MSKQLHFKFLFIYAMKESLETTRFSRLLRAAIVPSALNNKLVVWQTDVARSLAAKRE
jgi:hypothetical protein